MGTNNNTSIHHNYNNFTRKKPLRSIFHQNHTIYHHTIKMGGCGNSNCSCSSCYCAPGSCTCGKLTNPFTNRPSVTSPASTTMLPHHLGLTIVLFARERCVNEIFFGGVARHHGDCRDGSKGDLTKIRDLKMGGQRT